MRPPVFLGRRPEESADENLRSFYKTLLTTIDRPVFREGQWILCGRSGWPDNASFQNLVAWCWLKNHERYLVIVNLSCSPVQAQVQVPWVDEVGSKWCLRDALSGAIYERDAEQMVSPGLYVELGPWSFHFFHCRQAPGES